MKEDDFNFLSFPFLFLPFFLKFMRCEVVKLFTRNNNEIFELVPEGK